MTFHLPQFARGTRGPRRGRQARPTCEALEGRALLATYTALDPTFGQRGQVIGPVADGSSATLGNITAVAVQTDGKVVVAGTAVVQNLYGQLPVANALLVRRYNVDGTLDATFGTDGQADVPLPSNASRVSTAPRDVVVTADGSILLAASLDVSPPGTSANTLTEGAVIRLTSTGQLDTTFATGGRFIIPPNLNNSANLYALAVQADGKIVAVGGLSSGSQNLQLLVVRLTNDGGLDPSFNGTSSQIIPTSGTASAVGITPGGQILVASNEETYVFKRGTFSAGRLSRLNADGSIDQAFGTGGTLEVRSDGSAIGWVQLNGLAIQGDGRVVLVGANYPTNNGITPGPNHGLLIRLNADGSADPSFASSKLPGVSPDLLTPIDSVYVAADGTITTGGSAVQRFRPDGTADPTFGFDGRAAVGVIPGAIALNPSLASETRSSFVAPGADGQVVVAGAIATTQNAGTQGLRGYLARLLPTRATAILTNDYDGDGRSDIAAYLPGSTTYAIRPSGGGPDVLAPFGVGGPGNAIPAPGDFDGDGVTDLGVYLPQYGAQAIRYAVQQIGYAGYLDTIDTFGSAGPGASIPTPGDYDGDGTTDVAVYLPAAGGFAITPSTPGVGPGGAVAGGFTTPSSPGGGAYFVPFGSAGPGASIPVAADFDGDGKDDIAVYLPALGDFAIRPSGGAPAYLAPFGSAGPGASIPVAGDFDGDGKDDIAVYLPAAGAFAIKPSDGDPAYLAPFGGPGLGASIPAPGDYDGDGRADLAVYLPRAGLFAYRPSSTPGGPDVVQLFGPAGAGATIPTASIPAAQPPTASALAAAAPGVGVPLALTDDVLAILAGTKKKKRS